MDVRATFPYISNIHMATKCRYRFGPDSVGSQRGDPDRRHTTLF